MKQFKILDCLPSTVFARRDELVYDPPEWMKRGLSETATGYGKRLNSGYKIHFEGKLRRIYITIFSNSGTAWFNCLGKRYTVDTYDTEGE
jgi:hypothetical protein